MDVGALLLEACERARVSQAELARRAGTSPTAVSEWVRGKVSPTVASLSRVLAASGWQVRGTLEPLLAELDRRVDEVLHGTVQLNTHALGSLAVAGVAEQRWPVEAEDGTVSYETGGITWAFDGATALALHGLAFPHDAPSICLLFDDAARSWLSRGFVGAMDAQRISWWDASFEVAREHLRGMAAGRYGMLLIRPVETMPPVVHLQPEGLAEVVPVLTVGAVESAVPALAEVLARIRART